MGSGVLPLAYWKLTVTNLSHVTTNRFDKKKNNVSYITCSKLNITFKLQPFLLH